MIYCYEHSGFSSFHVVDLVGFISLCEKVVCQVVSFIWVYLVTFLRTFLLIRLSTTITHVERMKLVGV